MNHKCNTCEAPATRRCTGCKSAWYCSEGCQRKLWTVHIFDCNPKKPINTAYKLARSCYRDRLPDDVETSDDYGFTRAFTAPNRTKLLGLYKALIIYQNVEPKTLHSWRIKGTLVEEIKKTFEKVPIGFRSVYYWWFLENQYVLDLSKEAPADFIHETVMHGWLYAGGSLTASKEEIQAVRMAWPENRRRCLDLCMSLMANWHPAPDQGLWSQFGFCASPDEVSEQRIAKIYTTLFTRCPFNEFHTAYEQSALTPLLRKHALGIELDEFPYLARILDTCWCRDSVWNLKKYVWAGDEEPAPQVALDYGFLNCRTDKDRAELTEVYKSFFARRTANPPQLHKAAMEGKLYEYVGEHVKPLKKKFKRLMRNKYTLPDA